MIIHELRPHNAPRTIVPAVVLLLGLGLALAGCGGGDSRPAAGAAAGGVNAACPVRVDATAWNAFAAVAERATTGQPVTAEELETLGDLPAFTAWRESLEPNVPPALRVGNWFEDAFWDELGRTGDRKVNADRRAIAGSYRWAWEHRARVDSLAAALAAPGGPCGILRAAEGWIDADRLPSPLVVYLVPGKPELRYHQGRVLVDTGVLAAGSPAQLDRQIAGLLYRNLQAETGPAPLDAVGAAAVAHTFRILRNEGIAAWIEALPETHFDPEHPRLRRVTPVPEHFYQTTLRTVVVIHEVLPRLLDDPAALEASGAEFARTVAAGGGLNQGGYGMAALINARLGAARLQEAARTVPAFLAAYQEAALLNGADRPLLGAAGHESWEALGPIDAAVFERLLPLVQEAFPASS